MIFKAKNNFKNILEKKILITWYKPKINFFLNVLLLPFASLYAAVIATKKFLYRHKLLKSYKSILPVIVVGNITVGGTGKTPVVIALANLLLQHGLRPGIILRGYGKNKSNTILVDGSSKIPDITEVGDEARLIYNRTYCPIAIGANRVKSVNLLANINLCNIIISDDGLQHYKLQRDLEICVIDSDRMFGNNRLLPAGPLRERTDRINESDFVLVKSQDINSISDFNKTVNVPSFQFHLLPNCFVNIKSMKEYNVADFIKTNTADKIYGFCGIGNNANFFNTLNQLGFNQDIIFKEFPDHYNYDPTDFNILHNNNNVIITTEKDAVKLANLENKIPNFDNIFYLKVSVKFASGFVDKLLQRINTMNSQTKEVVC